MPSSSIASWVESISTAIALGSMCGSRELPALEALVVEDEAPVVEAQDLHPVAAARDEYEEVARVDILLELVAHDRGEPIDRLPHVDRGRADEDPDRPRQREHGL